MFLCACVHGACVHIYMCMICACIHLCMCVSSVCVCVNIPVCTCGLDCQRTTIGVRPLLPVCFRQGILWFHPVCARLPLPRKGLLDFKDSGVSGLSPCSYHRNSGVTDTASEGTHEGPYTCTAQALPTCPSQPMFQER